MKNCSSNKSAVSKTDSATKQKSSGKGGVVLTDEQKIALIKTGNPNGKFTKPTQKKK